MPVDIQFRKTYDLSPYNPWVHVRFSGTVLKMNSREAFVEAWEEFDRLVAEQLSLIERRFHFKLKNSYEKPWFTVSNGHPIQQFNCDTIKFRSREAAGLFVYNLATIGYERW